MCVLGGAWDQSSGLSGHFLTFLGDRNQPLYLLVEVGLLGKTKISAPDAELSLGSNIEMRVRDSA